MLKLILEGSRRHRLAWSRTSASQAGNPGSNPGGGTSFL